MAQADRLLYDVSSDLVRAKTTLISPLHSPAYIHHVRAYPRAASAAAFKATLVTLSHHTSPYLVPCQLLEEREREGWFEVEFIEQYVQSLNDYKKNQSHYMMSEEEMLGSLQGILEVLSWAQEAGIPHRAITDIAIQVSPDEKRLLVSWFQRQVPAEDEDIQAGILLPSRYCSPDLVQSCPYQADLYALGVGMVELVWTGSLPLETQGRVLYEWVESWTGYLYVKQVLLEMLRPAHSLTAQQLLSNPAFATLSQASPSPYTATANPLVALPLLTLDFTCVSISDGMLEIENSISKRKVEIQSIKTVDGKTICADKRVLGQKVTVTMLHGGVILSIILQESEIEVFDLRSTQVPTQSSDLQADSDVNRVQIPDNYNIKRHFDCRTCGKVYSIEPYQQADELFNFCSDECALRCAQIISSSSEAAGPGCMLCGKTWDSIKEQSLVFMPLRCSPSHFFCSSDHFRIYIDQEIFAKGVTSDQVRCPTCSKQIHQRDIEKALVGQTKSFRTMRENKTCFSCHSQAQELQLPCGHCFCCLCLPAYLQHGPSTPCPRCSNL